MQLAICARLKFPSALEEPDLESDGWSGTYRRYHPCNQVGGVLRNVDCGITYSAWLTDSDPPRAAVQFIATHVNGAETLWSNTSSCTLDPTELSHIALERYAAQDGARDDYYPNHQIIHEMV